MADRPLQLAGRIAHAFIRSKLTPLAVAAALLAGGLAVLRTPREEEPQIVVPMLDVTVAMPGSSAAEVSRRVTLPMEKLLRELPRVEYVYSISHSGLALVIVRFQVGTNEEDAIVQTYSKLEPLDRIAPGSSRPLVKPRSIDNVPILAVTLWGGGHDPFALRQLASEVEDEIVKVEDVSETIVIGGLPRRVQVLLDTRRLEAYGLSPVELARRIEGANARLPTGRFAAENREVIVEAGQFFSSVEELGGVVVAVRHGNPITLRQVATIKDGPAEPDSYVLYTSGRGGEGAAGSESPAVTIAVAKRRGTNATRVSEAVLRRIASLRGELIPPDVQLTVTRNYGETAKEKSNELLEHLLLATLSVTLLIALALGWRESGVVLIAVPVTLALTLAVFYLGGYTLNRVTLFALIFSIGILVDDAIVVVENIVRHFRLPESRGRSLSEVAVEAVDEVGNPTILATAAVIAAILPMAFVRGLMGPYMRPIPVGASAAMVFSLIVAFMVSPWAALRLLGRRAASPGGKGHETEGRTTRLYRRLMRMLLLRPRRRLVFIAAVVALFLAAVSLIPLGMLRVKMLPFDDKSEFQVIVDMPDGTPLEQTTRVAQALAWSLAERPEVVNTQVYAGLSGPYNFNGLVRHYFLRRGSNQADIQVNLLARSDRSEQSHDIARSLRPELERIAGPFGARIKVAEVPPGPPVLQTLVAEVYGPDPVGRIDLAGRIKEIFRATPGVVDVDWYVEDPQTLDHLRVDAEKAAIAGVSVAEVAATLQAALGGRTVGLLHVPDAREDVPIEVRLSRAARSGLESLRSLRIPTSTGATVALRDLTTVVERPIDVAVYRKNLRPVVYVTADVAGSAESPVYAILTMRSAVARLKSAAGTAVTQYFGTALPRLSDAYAVKWDGEWHITVEVFRDLGMAFAGVLVLIYVLVVGWFRSFTTPLVIMAPIPLTLVGILPAHALMGAFFTATSMIGFIAGAGIIVRNSIILVDFIELRRRDGLTLEDAVVDAGAVRFRPMLLTAAAVVVGASVILFDPIFQGLAISLMAGEVASTLLSRIAVPVLYYLAERP